MPSDRSDRPDRPDPDRPGARPSDAGPDRPGRRPFGPDRPGARPSEAGPARAGAVGAIASLDAHRRERSAGRRRGLPVECADVAVTLPALADGTERADRRTQRHVEGCLRCQADLVQYRKVLRALRQLRTEVLEPAPGVLTGILAGIEEAGEQRALRSLLSGRRVAYLGGVAAATAAAGAAGAVVLLSRASRRRVDLAG